MQLINLTGFQRGVAEDEDGINIREFKTTVEPEFIEFLNDKVNEARGAAIGAMKLAVSIAGEVAGATGLMAASAVEAFAPANSVAYFGAPETGLYLEKGEVTEARDGWKDVTCDFWARAGIP
jgi:hypothetical protein